MDKGDCNPQKLRRTYLQFKYPNQLFARWGKIYKQEIKPHLKDKNRKYTLLDVGCGVMDVSNHIMQLAKNDGYTFIIKGIDPEPVIDELLTESGVLSDYCTFEPVYLTKLVRRGESFDFVISNHLIHHLSPEEILNIMDEIESVTNIKAIMNDIHRGIVPLLSFSFLMWPFILGSFIYTDGIRSILRSYTSEELSIVLRKNWRIFRVFPYRLCLTYTHANHDH